MRWQRALPGPRCDPRTLLVARSWPEAFTERFGERASGEGLLAEVNAGAVSPSLPSAGSEGVVTLVPGGGASCFWLFLPRGFVSYSCVHVFLSRACFEKKNVIFSCEISHVVLLSHT